MTILGGVLTFRLLYPRKAMIGLKDDEDFWLFVNVTLFSGPASGKLLYLFEYTRPFSPDFWRSLFSWSGYSLLGAFVGMPLCFWLFCRRRKIEVWRLFDGCSVMAPFWHIFGRMGCLLAGCCHGSPTTWPWGIVFRDARSLVPPQWLGVPLHPTQPIEMLCDVILTASLYQVFKRDAGTGRTTALFFGGYGLIRFFVEFLRGDSVPGSFGLTAGQNMGLGLVAVAAAFIAWRSWELGHTPQTA